MNAWKWKKKATKCVFLIFVHRIKKNKKRKYNKHIRIPLNNIILTGDIGYWNVNCKKTFVKASEFGKAKCFLCCCILQHGAGWKTNKAHISDQLCGRQYKVRPKTKWVGKELFSLKSTLFILFFFSNFLKCVCFFPLFLFFCTIQVLLAGRSKHNVKLSV